MENSVVFAMLLIALLILACAPENKSKLVDEVVPIALPEGKVHAVTSQDELLNLTQSSPPSESLGK